MLEAALHYANLGYAIFPCEMNGKKPACSHGVLDATPDADTIHKWWGNGTPYNIGLACHSIVTIDIDPDAQDWPGKEKAATIKQLAPPLQKTPRGGYHIIFRRPENVPWKPSASRLAKGVDVRCGNSYIVVAPSVVNGKPYRWLRPLKQTSNLPLPPSWLHDALTKISGETSSINGPFWHGQGSKQSPATFLEGQRNDGLFRLGCRLRGCGASYEEIEAALLTFNQQRCFPPLPEDEVLRIARSIERYPCGISHNGTDILNKVDPLLRSAWDHAIRHRQKRYQAWTR
jgi:hypothetical protein